jgi:rod shape-determining protein MreD
MTKARLTALYLLAFIFQLTVVNIIGIKSVGPNLILCLTVVITFVFNDGWKCIFFGMGAALLTDICCGSLVGVGPLALFAAGIFSELARERLNTEVLAPLAATGAIATLVYNVLYWGVLKITGDPMDLLYMLKFQIFYIIYNIAVMFVIYYFMNKIRKKQIRKEDGYDI